MKQKLIAIGDGGCRFASSMINEGLFANVPAYFCDSSATRLSKYNHMDCHKTLLGAQPFSATISSDDIDKISSIIGHDRDVALIYVISLGSRIEAKYVPEFIIESSRCNLKMLVIYSEPQMQPSYSPNPEISTIILSTDRYDHLYNRCKYAQMAIAKFMQGRIVLHGHDNSNEGTPRLVIEMLKREGTDFTASNISDYCKKLRDKYPYNHKDRIFIQPDNYPYASFEERAETYNSNTVHRKRIPLNK